MPLGGHSEAIPNPFGKARQDPSQTCWEGHGGAIPGHSGILPNLTRKGFAWQGHSQSLWEGHDRILPNFPGIVPNSTGKGTT